MPKDRDLVKAWEEGKPSELERTHPPTSVLSIRVPSDVLDSLTERARARGVSTSLLARELIERSLDGDEPTTPDQLARMFSRWVHEGLPRPRRKRTARNKSRTRRETFEKRGGYAAPKGSISQMKPPPPGPAPGAKPKGSSRKKSG